MSFDHPEDRDEHDECRFEIERLNQWVADLQSGMYVNCVYCGHRYGPGETTPVSMADALKEHVEQCPQHPMSDLRRENTELRGEVATANLKLLEAGRLLKRAAAFIDEHCGERLITEDINEFLGAGNDKPAKTPSIETLRKWASLAVDPAPINDD